MQDLLDTLKARPGKLNFGTGTTNGRLTTLLFAKLTGTNFAIIPYKGSAETVEGLLTGSVDFGVDGMASSYPLIKDGKFRALAKLSDRPLSQLPDLPPLAEAAGVPARRHSTWIAFYAPAGTSSEITGKLSHFIATIYADPTVAKRLQDAGIIAVSSTPGELKAFVHSETERWGKVIHDNANYTFERPSPPPQGQGYRIRRSISKRKARPIRALYLPRREVLGSGWARATLRARRRRTARLAGALSLRLAPGLRRSSTSSGRAQVF